MPLKFKVPVFEVKSLSFALKEQKILSNVSFEIFAQEYVAIIGPNGGGKTTVAKMLLGLEKATSGEIRIFGKKLQTFKEWHKIGYVPQRASLLDASFPATVLDIVKMGRIAHKTIFNRFNDEDVAIVNDAMKTMGVFDLQDKEKQSPFF